ncbi:hypothetical protein TK5_25790 [Sideroxyarcus sp. TK5]
MAKLSKNAVQINAKKSELDVVEEPFSLRSKQKLQAKIIAAHDEFRAAVLEGNKDFIRELHVKSKDHVSTDIYPEIWRLYNKHAGRFISGKVLDPAKIAPSLKLVEARSIWEELFKITRHTWSIPYSKGYGRRLRFVVYDEYHEAVIGILGFQSPPADLACRDDLFNYPDNKKMDLINRTMDVYTIGAIPPYSNLLGGKLVAGLVSSDEIRRAYWKQYAGKKTQMNNHSIEQPLVAVTTTSVFGRSSIYNRLKYNGRLLAEPIGFTKGYGTIHLEEIYPDIQKLLLSETGSYISGGYGNGPKIRWQNFTRALSILNLPQVYFEHGLQREVFLFRFVHDLEEGMAGGKFGGHINLTVAEYADYWKERWALPRSIRLAEWNEFDSRQYFSNILHSKS